MPPLGNLAFCKSHTCCCCIGAFFLWYFLLVTSTIFGLGLSQLDSTGETEHLYMVVSDYTFTWLQTLSLGDLFTVVIWAVLLLRARICGQDLTYDDIRHSSLSGLERNTAERLDETEVAASHRYRPIRAQAGRRRSRSRTPFSFESGSDTTEDSL